jgi:DNA-binding response OmpR family regulator
MSKFLKAEGYRTAIANSGRDGIEKAKEGIFDVVVADIVLPDIHGFQVCTEIKKGMGKKSPRVIIITGVIDAVDVVGARKAGADDFCVKTQDMSQLIEAVKRNA